MFGKFSLVHVSELCLAVCNNLYGHIGVFPEAKKIYTVLLGSKKIDKNLGGRLELLTS